MEVTEASHREHPTRDLLDRQYHALCAEVRAHETTTRGRVATPSRPQDERLYRRLRQIGGMTDDEGEVLILTYPPELLPYG